jgi:hypothetical protein
LAGIVRSTYREQPASAHDDTVIIEAVAAICEEIENYGRRVRAELRHTGLIVNHKKILGSRGNATFGRAGADAMSPQSTAITTSGSFPIGQER